MIGDTNAVLLIHRFFKPDSPPYAFILNDIREILEQRNMSVDVLSSQPSYKSVDQKYKLPWKVKEENGSNVFRLPVFQLKNEKLSKLLNFIWFPFVAFCFILFGKKYQIVTVSTAPPVVLAFLVAMACKLRGFNLIYHCMDIHPEIGRISGEFKSKVIFKTLCWMDNYTCRTASKIIVLSKDMEMSLLNRNKALRLKIEVINNYDLSSEEALRHEFYDVKDNKKRVIFAGNIGRFQNLDRFVLALKMNPPLDNFELVFVGEGSALETLMDLAKGLEEQVRFISHQPVSVARQMIADADTAIVSLEKNVIRYAYPSKTMTYLAVGTPVLAMVETFSELSCFIQHNRLGRVVAHDETGEIYAYFKELSIDNLDFNREAIRTCFQEKFSKIQFKDKFISLVEDLV